MKSHYSFATFLLLLFTTGYGNDQAKVKESLTKWQAAKEQCKGDYSYKVSFSSFTGFGNETEVIVRNNKVTERKFRTFGGPPVPVIPGQPPAKPDGKTWVEKGSDLGSHPEGAPPLTMDELYAKAVAVAAQELAEHERRYVRLDKQGSPSSCFTIDTRIADDAPRNGVMISNLKLEVAGEGGGKVYKAPNGKAFPQHWGAPPLRQTRDLRPLPGGYGRGSGTLAKWIQGNLNRDAGKKD